MDLWLSIAHIKKMKKNEKGGGGDAQFLVKDYSRTTFLSEIKFKHWSLMGTHS